MNGIKSFLQAKDDSEIEIRRTLSIQKGLQKY